jgi:hypothetical protein
MGVISSVTGTAVTVVHASSVAAFLASVTVLGRLFRTKEVQQVLACVTTEEEALGPELLFGYRLAKRQVRDAIVAQSAEITERIRNEGASPRSILYLTIKEVCEADLGSGSLHAGRGELSMHGKALLALLARASKELETAGLRTREMTSREMERMRQEIARAG